MMEPRYERIARSLVARHADPKGVVEFYGGQFFGQLPATSYDYLLETLFGAGYTLIVVPFAFGFDHAAIAEHLLEERDEVRRLLPELKGVPHFWLGHSLGCKLIALLEAYTDVESGCYLPPGRSLATARRGILDEPALLMAPDISNTSGAIPFPALARLLDELGLGVRPNRSETQQLIERSALFGLTGLISFVDDRIAGNAEGDPATSDVKWFLETLAGRTGDTVLHVELQGGHLVPLGVRLADVVLEVDPQLGLFPTKPPAELELAVLGMLAELGRRRATTRLRRARRATAVPVGS